jgi:uncharacterized protein YggT (Ycf19 family)
VDGLVNFVWRVLVLLILVRVVLSWRKSPFSGPISRWIHLIVEPLLELCRSLVDTRKHGFDVAPVVALVMLWIMRYILVVLF